MFKRKAPKTVVVIPTGNFSLRSVEVMQANGYIVIEQLRPDGIFPYVLPR